MEITIQNQTTSLANNVVNIHLRQNKSKTRVSMISANLTNHSYKQSDQIEQKTAYSLGFSPPADGVIIRSLR